MVVWSAGRPRSMSNSATSRYESENRRYQRTAQTMISGSKCRHLNSAGRGLLMEYTAGYQTHPLGFCNIALKLPAVLATLGCATVSLAETARTPLCLRSRFVNVQG